MAKAITLLESTRADHRAQADELLTRCCRTAAKFAFRLGISGVPGVGKSTFIEALGLYLIGRATAWRCWRSTRQHVSGGSILGDKTRMEHLSVHDAGLHPPQPQQRHAGRRGREDARGHAGLRGRRLRRGDRRDRGRGPERDRGGRHDRHVVLLQLPNAGDDLQAIKKGVMELADLVVINKADIDPNAATPRTGADHLSAAPAGPARQPGPCAPRRHGVAPAGDADQRLLGQGVDAFWAAVHALSRPADRQRPPGGAAPAAGLAWMWERIDAGLKQRLPPAPEGARAAAEQQVRTETSQPGRVGCARNLLLARRSA
jgi:LAO/AO transport system kinase